MRPLSFSHCTALLITALPLMIGCGGGDTGPGSNGSQSPDVNVAGSSGEPAGAGGASIDGMAGASAGGATSMLPNNHGGSPTMECAATAVGGRVMRRLTASELNNSLRDIFQLPTWSGMDLTPDEVNDLGFGNGAAELVLTAGRSREILNGAETLVATVDWPTVLGRFAECGQAPASATCAASALSGLGKRLFRRALTQSELDRYTALFAELQAQSTFDDALRWSTVALIQSPHTLYRSELGQATTPAGSTTAGYVLDGYEIATALAYVYGGTAPSDDLLAAAERGELSDAAIRVSWARQLQALASGRGQFDQFLQGWLRYADVRNLAKSVAVFPEFAAVQALMVDETRAFIEQVVFDAHGSAADLLTSPTTVIGDPLAQYYGFPAVGATPTSVMRPAGRGIGLLAQGALLAKLALPDSSSPTQRGAFVREKLLCQELPPPPANVAAVPEFRDGVTTRQRYEELHTADPGCSACHQLTDQIGFAFEHYDGAGRYRDMESGQAINALGKLVGTDLTFDGLEQAAAALSQLPELESCAALHWVSFASGLERTPSECLTTQLLQNVGTNAPFENALTGYASIPHFTQRH
jgi:hypothetical protein